jgi:hypothetical protein
MLPSIYFFLLWIWWISGQRGALVRSGFTWARAYFGGVFWEVWTHSSSLIFCLLWGHMRLVLYLWHLGYMHLPLYMSHLVALVRGCCMCCSHTTRSRGWCMCCSHTSLSRGWCMCWSHTSCTVSRACILDIHSNLVAGPHTALAHAQKYFHITEGYRLRTMSTRMC